MWLKILVLVAAVGAVFGTGYKLAAWKAEVEWQQALAAERERFDAIQAKWREKELEFLSQEREVVTQIEVQEKEIIRYVEVSGDRECFDTAGVELFNQISTSAMSDSPNLSEPGS